MYKFPYKKLSKFDTQICLTTLNKRLVKPKICRLKKKQSKCAYYHDSPLQTNLTLMHISLRIIFIFTSSKNLNYLLTCIQKTFCCHDKDGSVQVRHRKSVSEASIVRKSLEEFRSFSISPTNPSFLVPKNVKIKQPSDLITRFHFPGNVYFFTPE